MSRTTTSADGTRIAYGHTGNGPALVLVDGALCHRGFGPSQKIAAELASEFTVYTYDRRGRGESADADTYAVDREIDDIAAVIDEAGGSACVFGISSGAILALDAANRLPQISRLAIYEPPFAVNTSGNVLPEDFLQRLNEHIAADRRGAAVRQFMHHVGVPRMATTIMALLPMWRKLKAVAHTLPYDITILGDTSSGRPLPTDRWPALEIPTLVMHGSKSPKGMADGVIALAATLGGSEHRVLEGQTHMVKPTALAPALRHFYAGEPRPITPDGGDRVTAG